jgi:tetrahydromethanopterin S-methyltransferase subunit B
MAPRKPGFHTLLSRENWPQYLGGMLTETAFIFALTGLAVLMAVIAKAVWR